MVEVRRWRESTLQRESWESVSSPGEGGEGGEGRRLASPSPSGHTSSPRLILALSR